MLCSPSGSPTAVENPKSGDIASSLKNEKDRSLLKCSYADYVLKRSNSDATLFRGVSLRSREYGRPISFRATITIGGKSVFLGYFSTKPEAARAYDLASMTFHGKRATTNFFTYSYESADMAAMKDKLTTKGLLGAPAVAAAGPPTKTVPLASSLSSVPMTSALAKGMAFMKAAARNNLLYPAPPPNLIPAAVPTPVLVPNTASILPVPVAIADLSASAVVNANPIALGMMKAAARNNLPYPAPPNLIPAAVPTPLVPNAASILVPVAIADLSASAVTIPTPMAPGSPGTLPLHSHASFYNLNN
jgi:hypothetical protein